MPLPGQAIVDSTGRPCVTTTGQPIVADAGGASSCVCGACTTYYKASFCSPGDCNLPSDIYVCTNVLATCCRVNGCGSQGERPIAVGDVIQHDGKCYRVNSLTTYPTEELPVGAVIYGLAASGEGVCFGPPYFSCSQCQEISGFVNCNTLCACIGGVGGGGLPPGGIYISCADLIQCLQTCDYCPVFRVQWPPENPVTFCVMPNYNAPTQPVLPSGAYLVSCNCELTSCCTCCGKAVVLPEPSCCSCDALAATNRCMSTYSVQSTGQDLRVRTTPYGCCWGRSGWEASGQGKLRLWFAPPFDTYPFEIRTLSVSGQVATVVTQFYDYSTGVETGSTTDSQPAAGNCGFFPGCEALLNLFSSGATRSGHVTSQCDLISWNYRGDNTASGGQRWESQGSISVTGPASNCNPVPCQARPIGEAGGCSGCGTIVVDGVSVEDLL